MDRDELRKKIAEGHRTMEKGSGATTVAGRTVSWTSKDRLSS